MNAPCCPTATPTVKLAIMTYPPGSMVINPFKGINAGDADSESAPDVCPAVRFKRILGAAGRVAPVSAFATVAESAGPILALMIVEATLCVTAVAWYNPARYTAAMPVGATTSWWDTPNRERFLPDPSGLLKHNPV